PNQVRLLACHRANVRQPGTECRLECRQTLPPSATMKSPRQCQSRPSLLRDPSALSAAGSGLRPPFSRPGGHNLDSGPTTERSYRKAGKPFWVRLLLEIRIVARIL